jgi:hypothetical protein
MRFTMKIKTSLLCGLFALTALLLSGETVLAVRRETRASLPGVLAVGLGKIMHTKDYLQDYPGSRTAILSYMRLDSDEVHEVARNLKIQAEIHEREGRAFWPQIALETRKLNLVAFHRELSRQGSQVDRSVRTLAQAIADQRGRKKWFFIRPFCEMNDATPWAPWEFGNKQHKNTPEAFAAAWKLLRETFDAEGATNAIFIFSPLAAYGVHREEEVLAALNRIPVGYIDAFSLNLYSRPMSAYKGNSQEPVSFASLAKPWMKVLSKSRHNGIPLAVAEMAVSNQATDAMRAKWLREAFQFARGNGFVLMTYFNFPHRYWHIPDDTLAGAALRAEMRRD